MPWRSFLYVQYLLLGSIVWIGLFVVLAGMDKKVGQINIEHSVGVFGKADGAGKRFVDVIRNVFCIVNAAQINKIEGSPSHNEHGLKVILVGKLGDVIDLAAVIGQFKLTHTDENVVYRRAVGQGIGTELYAASGAVQLLIGFGLNG